MSKRSYNETLKNWPIKKKLTFSFGTIIVSTFILIVVLLVGLKTVEAKVEACIMVQPPVPSTLEISVLAW